MLLSGCSAQDDGANGETRQNMYASRADCQKEWGTDVQHCNQSGSGYAGPRYYWNHAGGYPVIINTDGSTRALPATHIGASGVSGGSAAHSVSIARGGFGGTAHGFSAGG
jgi:hypothetical protein